MGDPSGPIEENGGHNGDTEPSSLLGMGPPSPLTGCYLLIIIGEPHSAEHKDIILQRLVKGKSIDFYFFFFSFDTSFVYKCRTKWNEMEFFSDSLPLSVNFIIFFRLVLFIRSISHFTLSSVYRV